VGGTVKLQTEIFCEGFIFLGVLSEMKSKMAVLFGADILNCLCHILYDLGL
jgi:hypothetical protein